MAAYKTPIMARASCLVVRGRLGRASAVRWLPGDARVHLC